jgi:hypothetical protein
LALPRGDGAPDLHAVVGVEIDVYSFEALHDLIEQTSRHILAKMIITSDPNTTFERRVAQATAGATRHGDDHGAPPADDRWRFGGEVSAYGVPGRRPD